MAATYRDPAERSGYLRLFYRDWRPTRLGRLVSGALAWLSGLGLTPRVLLTLQVKGRRSGRLRTNVLVVARHDGQCYLVSIARRGFGVGT
jgi:F420H(2)-dependent quinone reductase